MPFENGDVGEENIPISINFFTIFNTACVYFSFIYYVVWLPWSKVSSAQISDTVSAIWWLTLFASTVGRTVSFNCQNMLHCRILLFCMFVIKLWYCNWHIKSVEFMYLFLDKSRWSPRHLNCTKIPKKQHDLFIKKPLQPS